LGDILSKAREGKKCS
jgi:ribosome-binding protein aMBF1 (putative translation factor)